MTNEHALVQRLRNAVDLLPEEEARLRGLGADRTCRKAARRDVIGEGEPPRFVYLILSGWAGRYKQLPDGRRQLVQFLLPKDLCDIHNNVFDRMDHTIGAVTELRYAEIAHRDLEDVEESSPNIRRALWWHEMTSISVQREWTLNVGQRSAAERLGSLFCELFLRLRVLGLTQGSSFDMPLTQADLGEALSLTAVHVNRTLRDLRAARLIVLEQRRLTIPDLPALAASALFSPDYLHLRRPASEDAFCGRNSLGLVH